METPFSIRDDLGVFWRDADTIQVGLDPRVGVVIHGLTVDEQNFVASLTHPLTRPELDSLAKRHRIRSSRAADILLMLERAGLTHSARFDLSDRSVRIDALDHLGVSIGLGLARCGVGSIVFHDPTPVTATDHPALALRHQGLRRDNAFLTALRSIAPAIRTTGRVELAVVTGSRLVDPARTHDLWNAGTPHLLAWVEEVDTCVGPLVEPGLGPCAECVQEIRRQTDPAWKNLAPQAALASALAAPAAVRDLASALAAHAIACFLREGRSSLRNAQWRVCEGDDAPRRVEIGAHPACGCTADSPTE